MLKFLFGYSKCYKLKKRKNFVSFIEKINFLGKKFFFNKFFVFLFHKLRFFLSTNFTNLHEYFFPQ
jgi:hypothetical protein